MSGGSRREDNRVTSVLEGLFFVNSSLKSDPHSQSRSDCFSIMLLLLFWL